MAADRKAIRTSIQSINSTLHLTKAMGLVASSKMRRANENRVKSGQYVATFDRTMRLLRSAPECADSPYFRESTGGRTKLIVIAGDRGLAGGYNNNVYRFVAELAPDEIYPIGRRACEKYHGAELISSEHYDVGSAGRLIRSLCTDFLEGKFDRLGLVYTHYDSVLTQTPTLRTLLPLEIPPAPASETAEGEGRIPASVIFEPDEKTVLDFILPEYLTGVLCSALKESFASEVASRRNAMDSAGKNAQAMIDDLTLAYNRARQSAITQEITEIVAGAEG